MEGKYALSSHKLGCTLLFEQVSLHEVVDGLDDLELQVVLVWNRSLQMVIQLNDFGLINLDELVKCALCLCSLRFFYCSLKQPLDFIKEFIDGDQSQKFTPDLFALLSLLELYN